MQRSSIATAFPTAQVLLMPVKELLGHADIKTTMRYAHTNWDAKQRAVRLLGTRSDKTATVLKSDKQSV